MNIIFYPPPAYLKKFVRYFWSCDVSDLSGEKIIYFDNYADKHPRLVFQVDEESQLKVNAHTIVPKAYVCGIDTFPSSMSVQGSFSHFGVSFNSFALTEIFKTANEVLVNRIVDLNDLGYASLVKKLADAENHSNRIEVMCRFIDDQLNRHRGVHHSIVEIVLTNTLMEQTDLIKLQQHYNLTERTMERLFKSAMGISPKTFQRLTRFEKTLALLKDAAHPTTAAVGYLLNYTDQSHFIKDFKAFTDITPAQFQKNIFLFSESSAFISKL